MISKRKLVGGIIIIVLCIILSILIINHNINKHNREIENAKILSNE